MAQLDLAQTQYNPWVCILGALHLTTDLSYFNFEANYLLSKAHNLAKDYFLHLQLSLSTNLGRWYSKNHLVLPQEGAVGRFLALDHQYFIIWDLLLSYCRFLEW